MLGRRIPQFGRLSVVWRRFLQSHLFHLVGWRWCLLLRSRKCAVVHGCAGNGHSPGETQHARRVGVSPGEKCAEDPGYIRPVLVAGPPVYVWLVTGSLLFGSPLRHVWGLLQPPLLCQLCPGRAGRDPESVRVADTLVTSRQC